MHIASASASTMHSHKHVACIQFWDDNLVCAWMLPSNMCIKSIMAQAVMHVAQM